MAHYSGRDSYRGGRDGGRDSYRDSGYGGGRDSYGGGGSRGYGGGGRDYSYNDRDRGSSRPPTNKIYVGNLPGNIRSDEIKDLFGKFGKIVEVELKTGINGRGQDIGPPFAFVEFEDPLDAKEAIDDLDGRLYDKCRLKVEYPRGGRGGGGGFRGGFGGRGGRGGRGGGRRSEYSVTVSGLPPTGSWQDLKDHMREAGDVLYTDVYKDGTGYVEFARADDARYALKNLNDSKFRSHEGEVAYVTISEGPSGHRGGGGGGGGGGYRRSRSFSPPAYRRSRRSPSYSPARKYSRSRSRSPFSP